MFSSYSKHMNLNTYSLIKFNVRNYRKEIAKKNNSGIKKRLKIFYEENPELEKLGIDEGTLDQLETELTSGQELLDFHKKSIHRMKKQIDLNVIERKYFKQMKTPNFLLWAEKEQIRELHRSDPTFWTFDKLSKSFPANPDIVKKVINSTWRPETSDRVLKHDEHARKNWENLKRGNIQLDPSLKQHLLMFSSRDTIQHSVDDVFTATKAKHLLEESEFSKLITNYQEQKIKIRENNLSANGNAHFTLPFKADMNCLDSPKYIVKNYSPKSTCSQDRRMTTLAELRKIIREQKSPSEYSEYEKAFMTENRTGNPTLTEIDSFENIPPEHLKKGKKIEAVAKMVEEMLKVDAIAMKIKVPGDVPKGSVYKVKDVYYDTDGEFLYRVPGMK